MCLDRLLWSNVIFIFLFFSCLLIIYVGLLIIFLFFLLGDEWVVIIEWFVLGVICDVKFVGFWIYVEELIVIKCGGMVFGLFWFVGGIL